MDVVDSDPVDDAIRVEHRSDIWLYSRETQGDVGGPGELVDLGQLRGALRVDEIDTFEVEHERAQLAVVIRERTDTILERFGGCEEEAAVEAEDGDARKG